MGVVGRGKDAEHETTTTWVLFRGRRVWETFVNKDDEEETVRGHSSLLPFPFRQLPLASATSIPLPLAAHHCHLFRGILN